MIMSGMAPHELLPYVSTVPVYRERTFRVRFINCICHVCRVKPDNINTWVVIKFPIIIQKSSTYIAVEREINEYGLVPSLSLSILHPIPHCMYVFFKSNLYLFTIQLGLLTYFIPPTILFYILSVRFLFLTIVHETSRFCFIWKIKYNSLKLQIIT